LKQVNFDCILLKAELNQLVVALVQQLKGILVSELDEPQLLEDLGVDYSEVVVDSLVEHHVVDVLVDLLTDLTKALNAMDINQLQQPVDLLSRAEPLDECSEELDEVFIMEEDAEVQAVEERHRVLLDVPGELSYTVDNLKVEVLLPLR